MAKTEQFLSSVTRTFRAAIRVGEDFYTVEEVVTLPLAATDDEIAQAVALGERIYLAQRAAAEAQVRELRDQVATSPLPVQIREPDAPASDKQRQYMDYLVTELGWDGGRLHAYAGERQLDILTLTKREASELIDGLKVLLAERNGVAQQHDGPRPADQANGKHAAPERRAAPQGVAPAARPQQLPAMNERVTMRQLRALERLAEERGIDIDAELAGSYDGRELAELSLDEAGQLLSEWQQRPRQLRVRPDASKRAA